MPTYILLLQFNILLNDPHAFNQFKFQIMNNTVSITTQHTGQILAEALQAIKEAGQKENETIIASINGRIKEFEKKTQETLTQISDARTATVDNIDRKYDEVTADITKRGDKTIKRIAEERSESLSAMKKEHGVCHEQLQRQTGEHIQTLTEKTNESVAVIAKTTNKTLDDIAASLRNEETERKENEAVKLKGI